MVPLSKSGGQQCLVGSNPTLSANKPYGEVLEWTIRHAWRACVGFPDRGFESHPLRFATFRNLSYDYARRINDV